MSDFENSNEAKKLYNEIRELNNKSQQYTALYNKLKKDIYHGYLRDMKTTTERIFNDISDNYNGQRREVFDLAGQLNGNAQTMYQTLSTLLDRIYNKIEEINNRVKILNTKIEELK